MALIVKKLPVNAGDTRDVGSVAVSERSAGEGNGHSLKYSCLDNTMDRKAWWVTAYEGRKDSDTTEHALTHTNRLQRSTGIRLLPVYVELRNEGKERITE